MQPDAEGGVGVPHRALEKIEAGTTAVPREVSRTEMSRSSPGRQGWLLLLAASPVALLSVWYGFLESAGRHPSLKLGGAMALAGLGGIVLLVPRPVRPGRSAPGGHQHSALAEFHPLRLGLAW